MLDTKQTNECAILVLQLLCVCVCMFIPFLFFVDGKQSLHNLPTNTYQLSHFELNALNFS